MEAMKGLWSRPDSVFRVGVECSANTGKETQRAEGVDISDGSTVSGTKVQ
jgi:hypothetical protein